jgi:hypothetical protein
MAVRITFIHGGAPIELDKGKYPANCLTTADSDLINILLSVEKVRLQGVSQSYVEYREYSIDENLLKISLK